MVPLSHTHIGWHLHLGQFPDLLIHSVGPSLIRVPRATLFGGCGLTVTVSRVSPMRWLCLLGFSWPVLHVPSSRVTQSWARTSDEGGGGGERKENQKGLLAVD